MIRQAVIVGGMSDTEASAMMGFSGTMWPTIKSSDSTRSDWQSERERNTPSLVSQVKMWPTASASLFNDAEAPEEWLARAEQLKAKHKNGNGAGMPLAVAAKLSASATPTASDAKASGAAAYSTASGRHSGTTLTDATVRAQGSAWPTPAARDFKDTGTSPAEFERNTPGLAARAGGALNPAWVEQLMGFPAGWTSPLTDGLSAPAKRSPSKSRRASRKTARSDGNG